MIRKVTLSIIGVLTLAGLAAIASTSKANRKVATASYDTANTGTYQDSEPPMGAALPTLYLYKVTKEDLGGGMYTYKVDSREELATNGTNYAIETGRDFQSGEMYVIGTTGPILQSISGEGAEAVITYSTVETLTPGTAANYYTDDQYSAGELATIYRVDSAMSGTLFFDNVNGTTATPHMAEIVYFNYVGDLDGLVHKTVTSRKMSTFDGVNYTLPAAALANGERFNINTTMAFSHVGEIGHTITPGKAKDLDSDYYYSVSKDFEGEVTAVKNGDTYNTLLTQDGSEHIYVSVISDMGYVQRFFEVEPVTDEWVREHYDYDYVVSLPFVMGGSKTDEYLVISDRRPIVDKLIANTVAHTMGRHNVLNSDFAIEYDVNNKGTQIEFEYALTACPTYHFKDGNFSGKLYLSRKVDSETGNTVDNEYVGKFVITKSFEQIYEEFIGNDDLLDGDVDGKYPLNYGTKPIYHDNRARKDQPTINVKNGEDYTTHDLVYMDRRRAMTGYECNINRLASGSLASVVNLQNNLEKVTHNDLFEAAEFSGVLDLQLTATPLVSVRDEKRYYARGTEAGFNISGKSGVLSLSVIETLSLGFARDGEVLAVVPASSQEGTGVDLSLITISGKDNSFDLKAKSPVVFDEVCIFTAGGLKLSVGDVLNVNYAFVGTEANSEFVLSNEGRAAYNAAVNAANGTSDFELYVLSSSTTKHINGGVVKSEGTTDEFVGPQGDSEAMTIPVLSLGTLGLGWAEVTLDATGEGAPGDYEQIFPAGSRVNFKVNSGSLLKLGVGTGNTVSFLSRKNVTRDAEGNITNCDWSKETVVLTATVLELGVASVSADGLVSCVAPCDFSGVRLDVNDGAVNVGATTVQYASIVPPPFQDKRPNFGIPSMIYIDKTLVKNYENGELVSTEYRNPTEYTPTWDTDEAPELIWAFEEDAEGEPMVPAGSMATVDRETGTISGLCDGEFVVRYSVPGTPDWWSTVTYVVDSKEYDTPNDAEIRSIVGDGVVISNKAGLAKDYELTVNTHGTASGELINLATKFTNADHLLDGNINTYAQTSDGIRVAQNDIIIGVRSAKDGVSLVPAEATENGLLTKPVRIGFIVEDVTSGLNLSALNFLRIRAYYGEESEDPVYDSPIEENSTVGLDLIGEDPVYKKRYSVLIPKGNPIFDEFDLWTSGVLDINLSDIRLYGTFIEVVDEEDTNENWAVGNHADVIWQGATVYPQKFATADVASCVMKNLDFMIDESLETKFEIGSGVGVGAGTTLHIDLGRVINKGEKLGIIMANNYATAEVKAGDWMTVKFYAPVKGAAAAPAGQRRVASQSEPYNTVDDWSALSADVIGHGDRQEMYFTLTGPTSAIDIQLGDALADITSNNGIYGLTVAPAEDATTEINNEIVSGVKSAIAEAEGICDITVDAEHVATIEAVSEIKEVNVYATDGEMLHAVQHPGSTSVSIQLEPGIWLIQVLLTDGHARTIKVGL